MANEPGLAAHVERLLPKATIKHVRSVRAVASGGASVFQVELEGGICVAVKDYASAGPPRQACELGRTEAAALRRLGALQCPVPHLLAVDEKIGILITEWAGDRTLEEAASSGLHDADLAVAAIRAFIAVELGLDSLREKMTGVRASEAALALRDETSLLIQSLAPAVMRLASAANGTPKRIRRSLGAIAEQILAGHWTFGCKDCNASNVVLSPNGPVFIDFSVIGADWPERRLVGYLTATGAGLPGGNFTTLLDENIAPVYGRLAKFAWNLHGRAELLDSHFLVAMLKAAARIFDAQDAPNDPSNRALLLVWPNVRARLARLRKLVRMRLSVNPAADELREVLG